MSSAPAALEISPPHSYNSPSLEPLGHVSLAGDLLDPAVRNEILAFERETAEAELVVSAFVNVLTGRYSNLTERDEVLEAVRRHATEVLEIGQTSARIALWEAKRKVGTLALLTVEC